LANIYGPCGEDRNNCVQWMYDLQIYDFENWMLIGDHNFYRAQHSDRNKYGGNVDDMLLFNDVIRSQNLVDLPLHGATYTWSNMQSDPLFE
jgi:hypothetical protein